ncbi:MAG TPA: 6-phosphogluconolactonase, partial [Thermoplasmata archaeon]|nr:6-phosphogluconolactonase [Thermoplasmata archaeon]
MSEVRRFADPTALASAAAQYVLETLQGVIATRGRALVALAGGATPKELYERLGEVSSATFPWGQVHLFWGDERFVPYDSPDSNFRLAEESLLSRGAVPLGNVHPVPVEEADPEAAARAYELALRGFLPEAGPSFDLTVLG